jgi:xanthine dehydrogenase YagT iron-sulfur-binding subunit
MTESIGPAAAASAVRGPDTTEIHLHVNGQPYTIQAPPARTLLDALREDLGLTGAKKVCDQGQCGACTVLRDGVAVYACLTLAVECGRSEITTIEGLAAPDGTLHPIQQAFLDCDGLQCGFCTPGQILAMKALLDRHPNPTPDDIARGMSGNLCRCGAYPGIRRAAEQAARALQGA